MDNSKRLTEALQFAESFAVSSRVEFLTPELLLVGICCRNNEFMALCESYHVDYQKNLKEPIYGDMQYNSVPEEVGEYEILPSVQYVQMMTIAENNAASAGKEEIDSTHVLHAMLQLEESQANYILRSQFTEDETELLRSIIDAYEGRPLPDRHPEIEEKEEEMIDGFFGYEKPRAWTELASSVMRNRVHGRNSLSVLMTCWQTTTRSSDVKQNWIVPFKCCAGAIKTTRCMWANPVSVRPHSYTA